MKIGTEKEDQEFYDESEKEKWNKELEREEEQWKWLKIMDIN